MATKSQLKEYFKSQKIPTEAQFGTLIDSNFLLPKNQVDNTIQFGNGDESGKPHLRAYRHVRKNETVQGKNYSVDYHMFLTLDGVDVNCPVFVIMTRYNMTDETSETRFGEFTDMNESSGAGIDFFDETDEECIAILEGISYYKFAKDGGNSNPLRVYKYSNSQTKTIYNAVFEEQTIFGINGIEYTIPVCIKTIGNYPYANSQAIYMIETVDALNQIETAWNAFKDNFDNTDFSQVNSFISNYYIKISNNIE